MRKAILSLLIFATFFTSFPLLAAKTDIRSLPPYEVAILIIKKYETLHKVRHYPTIGYGHVVQKGESSKREYS